MEPNYVPDAQPPRLGDSESTFSSEQVAPFVPSDSSKKTLKEYKDEGWSWGSFAFSFIFLIAVRKYKIIAVLFFVPLLTFLGSIFVSVLARSTTLVFAMPFILLALGLGVMIFLGIQGRKFARESTTFSNHEQYLGFMKGVDHAGKVFIMFYVSILVIGFLASIILASLGSARDRAHETDYLQQQRSEAYKQDL